MRDEHKSLERNHTDFIRIFLVGYSDSLVQRVRINNRKAKNYFRILQTGGSYDVEMYVCTWNVKGSGFFDFSRHLECKTKQKCCRVTV